MRFAGYLGIAASIDTNSPLDGDSWLFHTRDPRPTVGMT